MTSSESWGHHPTLQVEVKKISYQGNYYLFPRKILDRYEVKRILAIGGFGILLDAEDQRIFQRKVLIKANRYEAYLFQYPHDLARDRTIEEQRNRLLHEMKMLRVAQQRRVAGTPVLIDKVEAPSPYLYGPHQGQEGGRFHLPVPQCMKEPYVILSFVEGQTLERACRQEHFRRQLLGNIKSVMVQLAGILEAFHQYETVGEHKLSFIYQDLKPDNVIWTRARNTVLIDFGSFAARTQEHVVPHNIFVSTYPYQPPEFTGLLSPEDAIQPTADIYALGVTVLHLLRGNHPVDATTGLLDSSVDALQLPEAWSSWLKKAINPDPTQRFVSMHEAQQAAFKLPTGASLFSHLVAVH